MHGESMIVKDKVVPIYFKNNSFLMAPSLYLENTLDLWMDITGPELFNVKLNRRLNP